MAMQTDPQITVEFNVPAKMRDGVTLRSNIYRPAGEGQWPVLLTRLPYGKDLAGAAVARKKARRRARRFISCAKVARAGIPHCPDLL